MCQGLPGGSDGKESACNTGDTGSIPGLGRSPRKGNGYPLQYSCLENSVDREALMGYHPWGHKESNTAEGLTHTHTHTYACTHTHTHTYTHNRLLEHEIWNREKIYTFTEKGEGPWKKQTKKENQKCVHGSLCPHYWTAIKSKFMFWDQGISL